MINIVNNIINMVSSLLPIIAIMLTAGCCIQSSLAVYSCGPNEVSTFIRISRARLTGTPVVISTAGEDITCSQFCKNNVEPTTGAQRACAAFNYDGRETCYFFDNAATPAGSGVLAPNPSANNFYYEKVCLPDVTAHQACAYRSYSFERIRKSMLEGFVQKSIRVNSREQCLSACLREEEFVCRSVNYNYNTYFCELSTEDRRSKPQYMRQSNDQPIDYFDSNCLSRQNRCGQIGGNLIFVKTHNFEIHYYDHTSSVEAKESYCLQKCLDSVNTFCRSVEFSPTFRKCIISDEDTFSRADNQGEPHFEGKDYYEPICVAADLTSSTCRQQAAFERFIGHAIQGQPIATAQGVTVSDCISLCFQNLECKALNYDRTQLTCFIYGVNRESASVSSNPSTDYYEFNCESQFGGMALCTNEGIRFIVNTKEPYTGAIYAAERFATCSQVVQNSRQIQMTFPPPTASTDCGTEFKDGRLEAMIVVSLDGVLPHQVTTEWDRFYRVSCDTSLKGIGEGSVVVTTLYDTTDAQPEVLPAGTPGPVSAALMFLDAGNSPVSQTAIGEEVYLVVRSEQAGPSNMMLMDCTATRVGGNGALVPFKVIDNGCPRYPALVGPVVQDFQNNRLAAHMKAFRLDGSYDVQMVCQVMFCAGPNGCPPSNCLDSGNNQLFQSHGRRKKRGVVPSENINNNNSNNSTENDREDNVEETLSAVLRVLADGEEEIERSIIQAAAAAAEQNVNDGIERSQNIVQVEARIPEEMMCMAESSFIAILVTVSLLCVLFSGVIVAWGCNRLRRQNNQLNAKLAGAAGSSPAGVVVSLGGGTQQQSSRQPSKIIPVVGGV